jgi:hypothetical protein
MFFFALTIGAALGVRVPNRTASSAAKNETKKNLRLVSSATAEEAEAPVLVVEEVPVVQVMVVDDADEGAPPADGNAGPPGLTETCAKEMQELQTNTSRTEHAKACESNTSHVQHAIEALQRADKQAALTATQTSFRECGGLTESCAKEVAPQVVLKLRLSGATIEQTCATTAENASHGQEQPSAEMEKCQQNTTMSMVQGLQKQDLETSLDAAQHGLAHCFEIEHPCDFQLAPILVMHLLEAVRQQQQQQQITEVLLAGMRAAQLAPPMDQNDEVAAEGHTAARSLVMASTSAKATNKVAVKAMAKVAQKVLGKTVKAPKALSLLSLNRRVRVTIGRRAL